MTGWAPLVSMQGLAVGLMINAQRVSQVGVAEEEVEVALPETTGVVGIAEPVVDIMELVRSTELLVDDMVPFVEIDELWY